jgi:hypothetical protein
MPNRSFLDLRSDSALIIPELAEAALRSRRGDQYVAWTVLRTACNVMGDGGGCVPFVEAENLLSRILFLSSHTIQRTIKEGSSTFWRLGESGFHLQTPRAVADKLEVNGVSKFAFSVPLYLFEGGFRVARAILLLCVAGRDRRPVSVINLAERCGVSERTVQNYNEIGKSFHLLRKGQNWEQLSEADPQDPSIRIVTDSKGEKVLLRRLPDTHHVALSRVRHGEKFGRGEFRPKRLYVTNPTKSSGGTKVAIRVAVLSDETISSTGIGKSCGAEFVTIWKMKSF